MENIISETVIPGSPGGGTHSHYLALDGGDGGYELRAVQDRVAEDGTTIGDIPHDDYSVFDPDGELGEGACWGWDNLEIIGWDEDYQLLLKGYCSSHYPENFDDVPEDIEFTDPEDPQLSVILKYFRVSVEDLKKECEKLQGGGDAGQAGPRSYGLIGSARHGDVEAVKRNLGASPGTLNTALFLAAWRNDLDIMKLLIGAGADVKAVFYNENSDEETTALMVAGPEASNLLVEAGAERPE